MNMSEMIVKTLSPGFCGGADQSIVELRAPSVRGHLRRWHTRLFNKPDMETVWGSVGKQGGASKIQLRIETFGESVSRETLLPHKSERGGVQNALSCEFNVLLASRDEAALERAEKTLRLWTLLGGIGARSNRAAGSVWPVKNAPKNAEELRGQLDALSFSKADVWVSAEYDLPEELRRAASDTLKIPCAGRERKESPLKIKMVEFEDGMHLMLWAEQRGVVDSALRELQGRNKPLSRFKWDKLL